MLGVIWGASFLGVELALTGFGPITLAAGRVGVAAVILVTITIVYGDGLPRFQSKTDRRIWLHCLGMALFTNAIPFCLLSWGQQIVTSSFAGISMAVVPLFVLPLSHFLVPGEVMSRIKTIGFLFGFGGVVLLIGGDKILADAPTSPLMLTAQMACVTASCCYAIGSIITRLCPTISALSFGSISNSGGHNSFDHTCAPRWPTFFISCQLSGAGVGSYYWSSYSERDPSWPLLNGTSGHSIRIVHLTTRLAPRRHKAQHTKNIQ